MIDNKIVSQEYSIAATEVVSILNKFSDETLNRIPKKLLKFLKEVSVDRKTDKKLQQTTDKTKDLLAMIYRNYLCTESERLEFDKKLLKNQKQYEDLIKQKYNPDIFKNKKEEKYNQLKNSETSDLIEYKEERWYKKIFKNIINFLKKR